MKKKKHKRCKKCTKCCNFNCVTELLIWHCSLASDLLCQHRLAWEYWTVTDPANGHQIHPAFFAWAFCDYALAEDTALLAHVRMACSCCFLTYAFQTLILLAKLYPPCQKGICVIFWRLSCKSLVCWKFHLFPPLTYSGGIISLQLEAHI